MRYELVLERKRGYSVYKWAFILGGLVSLGLTPLIKKFAERVGAVDEPGGRSVHQKPTPHLGGLAIFIPFSLAVIGILGWDEPFVKAAVLGGLAILAVGVVDDFLSFTPLAKLVGQILAAFIPVAYGIQIEFLTNPLGGLIYLGVLSLPLTVFWIVSFTNIINLIDGLDGLAAGVSVIASLILMVSGLQMLGTHPMAEFAVVMTAALAGSALGFLPYNFNPAKIFMGDAGAMFLGFALAVVSVEGLLKSTAAIALAIPVLALGLPIMDTVFAVIRRVRNGQPIGKADRGHIHHRLLSLGLSHRDAVLVMYLVSGWLGISALALIELSFLQAMTIIFFVIISLYFAAKKVGVFEQRYGEGNDSNKST